MAASCPFCSCWAQSEGFEGPGGVPDVVAAGGADAGVPGRFTMPMARLRRVAMAWGPLPVRIWEASSP